MINYSDTAIEMPSAFPQETYHAISHRMATHQFGDKFLHTEWNYAWNCVANRFAIAVECRDSFSHLLHGPHSHEVRYRQEKELFLFYCASVSCIESLCYAILAFINTLEPSLGNFRGEHAKKHNKPELLLTELERVFPAVHLTQAIKHLVTSDEYGDLHNKRAILFHRQSPGRVVGGEHDGWVLDGTTIDEHLLEEHVNFLSKKLHTIFRSLHDMVAQQ